MVKTGKKPNAVRFLRPDFVAHGAVGVELEVQVTRVADHRRNEEFKAAVLVAFREGVVRGIGRADILLFINQARGVAALISIAVIVALTVLIARSTTCDSGR